MRITIINQQKKIPINKRATENTVRKILRILKVVSAGELTVAYVNNKAIQELNYRFLDKNHPTDVLCFDLSEGNKFIADIIISTEKAGENSRIFNTSPKKEIALYLIHGILHLLGYKDYRRKDRKEMQRKANQILDQI